MHNLPKPTWLQNMMTSTARNSVGEDWWKLVKTYRCWSNTKLVKTGESTSYQQVVWDIFETFLRYFEIFWIIFEIIWDMFVTFLRYFEIFWDLLKYLEIVRNNLKYFWDTLKSLEIFWDILKILKYVWDICEIFGIFWDILK